jgi:hypothetical protein
MPRSCVVAAFDVALLHSPADCGGSEAGTLIGGMEAPAKLFCIDWLKHAGSALTRGPPIPHSSTADILGGTTFPQLINFSFSVGEIFGFTTWIDFAL